MENKLYTTGDLARSLNVEKHRILYVIQSRGIEAFGRVGAYRVYSQEQADQIRSEIALINQRNQ